MMDVVEVKTLSNLIADMVFSLLVLIFVNEMGKYARMLQ